MKNKNRILDILLVVFVFTFCISFPINLFTDNQYIILAIQLALKLGSIAFTILFTKHSKNLNKEYKKTNYINLLILLPVLLAVVNNFIYLGFTKETISFAYDNLLPLNIALTIATAINEELVFRYVVHQNLNIKNKLLKIITSAAIFGLFHIVVFISTFNPYDLIIIAYTFGLGLILGFIYEYVHNIYACITFHFLYNLLNTDIYLLFNCPENNLTFYLVAISTSVVIAIYVLIIYIIKFRKEVE